jgi:hypothetical protein
MKQIIIQGIEFNVPTKYNELTMKQLKKVTQLHIANTPENQINVLWYLLDLKWYKLSDLKKWGVVRSIGPVWIHTLLSDKSLFGWIFGTSNLTEYKIKSFRFGLIRYHGPVKNILNLNAAEVTFGYELFKLYSENAKEEYLNSLVAILYRRKNPLSWVKQFFYGYTGDIRLPLNSYTLEKRAEKFKKMPLVTKMIIFLMFAGKWDEFQSMERNKLIFPKLNEVNNKKKSDPLIWQKIMMKMAESGVFGDLNNVEKMDKDRFFLAMVKNVEEYIEMKDKQQSRK